MTAREDPAGSCITLSSPTKAARLSFFRACSSHTVDVKYYKSKTIRSEGHRGPGGVGVVALGLQVQDLAQLLDFLHPRLRIITVPKVAST